MKLIGRLGAAMLDVGCRDRQCTRMSALDQKELADELGTLCERVDPREVSLPTLVLRLYDLTSAMFDHPLAAELMRELEQTYPARPNAVQAVSDAFVETRVRPVQQQTKHILQRLRKWTAYKTDIQAATERLFDIESGSVETLEEAIDAALVYTKYHAPIRWQNEQPGYARVVDKTRLLSEDIRGGNENDANELRRNVDKLDGLIRAANGDMESALVEFTIALDLPLAKAIDFLRSFHRNAQSLLHGNDVGNPGRWKSMNVRQLAEQAQRVVTRARTQLRAGPIQNYLLHRLVAYLEQFCRDPLREEALDAASPESVVQAYVDRFLFEQGAYPITHCQAGGRGLLDSFVPKLDADLGYAAVHGFRPLLLELKQDIRGDEELATLGAEGRAQAREYERTVRARGLGVKPEVCALVVFGGARREAPAMEGALFAYVGEQRASEVQATRSSRKKQAR